MIPFYIFYSMFGFQRIGDLAWAAGDLQARGFLIGGTAGRTTLAGEGLQHQDGHSHLQAAFIPNCVAYDPAFMGELAVIVHAGLQRMYADNERVFYYVTVMNENYAHPPLPEGAADGVIRGIYRLVDGGQKAAIQLLGSGAILREVLAAAELLKQDYGITAHVWSVTSFNELCRDGQDCERWNRLHPDQPERVPYVTRELQTTEGPIVAATDYMHLYAEQIRPFLPHRYVTLGADGFGRSDGRAALRRFFEVDRQHIAVAALKSLADEGSLDPGKVLDAIRRYGLDAEASNPATV
jgi:pyruvate dehydrogenase E1 component